MRNKLFLIIICCFLILVMAGCGDEVTEPTLAPIHTESTEPSTAPTVATEPSETTEPTEMDLSDLYADLPTVQSVAEYFDQIEINSATDQPLVTKDYAILGSDEDAVIIPMEPAQAVIDHDGTIATVNYTWCQHGEEVYIKIVNSDSCTASCTGRYLVVCVGKCHWYFVDVITGECHDPLAEIVFTPTCGQFTDQSGQYFLIPDKYGTGILVNIATDEVIQLPKPTEAPDCSFSKGEFLDNDNILILYSFWEGFELAKYCISTGELTQCEGRYQSRNRNADNYLVSALGDSSLRGIYYTFIDGILVLRDFNIGNTIYTGLPETDVNSLSVYRGHLFATVITSEYRIIFEIDFSGQATPVCKVEK